MDLRIETHTEQALWKIFCMALLLAVAGVSGPFVAGHFSVVATYCIAESRLLPAKQLA